MPKHPTSLYAQLKQQGLTNDEIAERLGVQVDSVRRAIDRTHQKNMHEKASNFNDDAFRDKRHAANEYPRTVNDSAAQKIEVSPPLSADKIRSEIESYLGTSARLDSYSQIKQPRDWRKVVLFGDTHGKPSTALTGKLIDEQADIYVHGGDVTQQEEFSQHDDLDPDSAFPIHDPMLYMSNTSPVDDISPIQWELAAERGQLEALLMHTNGVIKVLRGNHDDWALKEAATKLPPHILRWVVDPLALLIAYLPKARVELLKTPLYWNRMEGGKSFMGASRYISTIGRDCIISHANFVGANAGDAVRKLYAKLRTWGSIDEIAAASVFVQFHAHKLSTSWESGGRVALIEPGMAADPSAMSYQISGYNLKWNPGVVSAVSLIQYHERGEWLTDKTTIKPIFTR